MKKFAVLTTLVCLALIIDGTLTYDIFDFREETHRGWGMILLALFLFGIILLADSSKNDGNKDNSE